jgi:hypothetical protein
MRSKADLPLLDCLLVLNMLQMLQDRQDIVFKDIYRFATELATR